MISKFERFFETAITAIILLCVSQPTYSVGSVRVAKVEASSYYTSKKYGEDGLHPNNLIIEKAKFGGWISDLNQWQNSWVDFYFDRQRTIKSVEILNGFIETSQESIRDDYYYHLRPRKLQIIPDGVEKKSIYVELKDSKEKQLIELNFSDKVTKIRLVIHSVYRQSPDTKISAHEVVGLRRVRWY